MSQATPALAVASEEASMDQTKTQGPSKEGLRESAANSISRAKEGGVSAAASDARESAGADLKALQSDLSHLKETVAKLVSRTGEEATKSAREIAGQVSGAASDLADKGANVASAATDRAKSLVTELENIARRNPLGALAGAVVVGVLIGMMRQRS
jgi:ElaB/YqjD/DUF883 family membrane-anchored ribosome-binding protein